ncbi:MAG: hypothetical protein OXC14_17225 [Rhodospirillaceae bacterium]|nr:hypothetical protein [Rhodospirillaceae bacterium]
MGDRNRKRLRRRQELLTPVARALGTEICEGRLPRRQRGIMDTGTGEVRVRAPSDAEAAGHELAHLIDSRLFGPALEVNNPGFEPRPWLTEGDPVDGKAPLNRFGRELVEVSYDNQNVAEGFAEAVRLWATQPKEAAKVAPTAVAWLDNRVRQGDDIGKALGKARDNLREWFEAEPIERLASKIGEGDQTAADRALDAAAELRDPKVRKGLRTWFGVKFWNDLNGIYHATGGESRAYQTARLARGANGMTEGVFRLGAPDVVWADDGTFEGFDYEGKSLEKILDMIPVKERPDWERYIAARSASELKEQGRENLFTDREIEAGVKLGENNPHFEEAFQEWLDLNSKVVDAAVEMGIISAEQRKTWRRELYVPFHRVGARPAQTGGQGRPGAGRVWNRLTGGTENIKNPIRNMAENVQFLVKTMVVNNARRQAIADIIAQGGESAKHLVQLKPRAQATKVNTDHVRQTIEDAFADAIGDRDKAKVLADAWAVEQGDQVTYWSMVTDPAVLPDENVVAVLIDGKPEYYEIGDQHLFTALSRISRPTRSAIMQGLNNSRRFMQSTVTLGLDFQGANIVRDQLSAIGYSRGNFQEGARPIIDAFRGLYSRVQGDQDYQEWMGAGGNTGSFGGADDRTRAKIRSALKTHYARHGLDIRTLVNSPVDVVRALDEMSQALENATRLAEYKRVKRATGSRRQAAYAAREVSTDFSVRGASEWFNNFQDSVMFLAAGMAGMERAYRGLKTPGQREKLWTWGAMLAGFSAGLYALNAGNPWYESLEDWDKDAHWHFFVPRPDYEGGEPKSRSQAQKAFYHYRVPKFWDIGAAASASERTIEMIETGNYGEGALRVGKGSADQFKLGYFPALALPAYEVATNRSMFSDAPIESFGIQRLPAGLRATPSTSAFSTEVGGALDVSPKKMDHLIRGYFNFFGTQFLRTSDVIAGKRDVRVGDLPGIKRFVGRTPGTPQHLVDYYEMLYEQSEYVQAAKKAEREGDRRAAIEYRRKAKDLPKLERFQKRLQSLRAQQRRILESKLPAGRKRQLTDQLETRRNDEVIRLMDAIEQFER